jgi:hypothetical protein
MDSEKTLPLSPQKEDYSSRITTKQSTLKAIKETGYDTQEALNYFPQLLKDCAEAKRKYEDLRLRIDYTMDVVTKASEELTQEARTNRRLRRAIMALHGEDYWKIIQKAERGYYELLGEQDK